MTKLSTEYEKPVITDYGDLAELTAANTSGNELDANFPFLPFLSCDPSHLPNCQKVVGF
jgi:hypothetical protein